MRPLFENMTTDVNQSAKIGDYGIHIGGARKEQVTGRSTKTSDKEGLVKFTHPFWLPVGYMVDHLDHVTYIIHSGFISGYQNRYGDNLKPPTNVYHRMTA